MLKTFLKLFFTTLFLVSSLNFISCGNVEEPAEQDPIEEKVEEQEIEEKFESTSFILPSPLQIASLFKKSGMGYVPGITNPTSNIEKYTGNHHKSLAMGVYSADLAYGIVNNQTQEALNYLRVIKDISNDLGLSTIFGSESLLTRFEKNMGNEDSLAFIISDLQLDLDAFLEENDKEHISVLIFTGAWIESVYIGSKTIENKSNKNLTSRIGEQFIILNNLIKGLKANKNENFNSLIADLEEIKKLNESFSQNIDEEEDSFELQADHVNQLSEKIQQIRMKIIEGNL